MEPENDCDWKPKLGMIFDSEQCAYEFYNTYGGRMGFSIRRDYCKKDKFTNKLIHRLLVCNKEGFRKVDKRDPLSKNSRAETRTGCEARLYIKLHEGTGKYVVTDLKDKHNHGKLSAHFGVGNEVRSDHDTQSFEVECEDVNHVVQPKGLKKKVATSKGKRRVIGGFEAALVANSKKKSRANSLASSQSIASSTVAPSPLSVGGDIYVHEHVPPLQPLPPLHPLPRSLPMGGNYIPPPLMYPTYHANNLREMYGVPNYLPTQSTFQSLLQGSCGYDIGFRYSQESTTPMCSQTMDNYQHNQTDAEIGLQRADMASRIVKQTVGRK